LTSQVVGQSFAAARVTTALHKALAGLGSAERPKHVFAFFGGSGVGKTAFARAMAEQLFGSPDAIVRLDMSEYKEPHTISRLWGSPPGYIGYHDEGTFSSRLRRQPFAIVLLDEFEKSHPEVHDAFLQIFDNGQFTDARGRLVTARHVIFTLTSNLFTVPDLHSVEEHELQAESVRQRLSAYFRAELINRIDDIILFRQLSPGDLADIAHLELERLNARLAGYGVSVSADSEALKWIGEQAFDPESGARSVQRLISRRVAEPLSVLALESQAGVDRRFQLSIQHGNLRIVQSQAGG
jgi:ATP-dependent Clp protease ATP-binding subunit ClpC